MKLKLSQQKLIAFISVWFVLFYNYPMFSNAIKIYPLNGINIIYLFSLAVILTAFINLFFTLLSSKYTTKPLLIITLLVSSFTTYFMNTYNVVIDEILAEQGVPVTDVRRNPFC
jgi:lipid A ethanolaminephosphotransferase